MAGDSAGANLALALMLAERHTAPAHAGALFYGSYAPNLETASRRLYGAGAYGLSASRMDWYWRNYLRTGADPPPLAAPLHADLRGLPPILVDYAELDVLADESRLLARKLRTAGVRITLHGASAAPHGYIRLIRDSRTARDHLDFAARHFVSLL